MDGSIESDEKVIFTAGGKSYSVNRTAVRFDSVVYRTYTVDDAFTGDYFASTRTIRISG